MCIRDRRERERERSCCYLCLDCVQCSHDAIFEDAVHEADYCKLKVHELIGQVATIHEVTHEICDRLKKIYLNKI